MDWQSQGPLRIYWSFHSSVLTHEKNAASHQQNVGAGRAYVTAQDLSSEGQCVLGRGCVLESFLDDIELAGKFL